MLKFKKETEFKKTEIGEVPGDWEVKRLGEVVSIVQGKNISTLKLKEDGYPVFGANGLIGYCDEYHYEDPQVLIACRGSTCGVINWSLPFSFINNNAMALLPKKINRKFLFSVMDFCYKSEMIDSVITGTGQPQITKETLSPFLIPYPSLPEQSRIATVLSWFDDLIENKKRQNEILEKTAMAIFKSWFVDFEPFKDSEFVYNEELGKEIPKGWEVKRIGDVAEFTKGLSYKGSEKFYEKPSQESFVFITLDNILRKGGFKTEYTWLISDRLKERHFLTEGDLIIANTDMTQNAEVIGSPAIVIFPYDYKREIGIYSHHITKIHLRKSISKYYLYLFLKYTQSENTTFSTGTNVLGLDISNFKQNKLILLPPQPILQRFHSLVEPLFRKIILN